MIYKIKINNSKILNCLKEAEFSDISGSENCRIKGFIEKDYGIVKDYSTSESYLNSRIKDFDDTGRINFAQNKIIGETMGSKALLGNLKTMLKYDFYYTSGYDPKGFVGWHNDMDMHGWYISLVYQKIDEGFLHFRNPKTKTIEKYINPVGWSSFCYKIEPDKENALWHCAWSDTPRFTFLLRFLSEERKNNAIKFMEEKYERSQRIA